MRELLAATCLTAATAAAAHAGTVAESTDFGNTFGSATVLPVGTDVVTGAVSSVTDNDDYFSFNGLLGGGSFSLSFLRSDCCSNMNFFLYNSSGSLLNSGAANIVSNGLTASGTVPLDGILVAQAHYVEGGPYIANLTAPLSATAPEPATMALAGLGIAVAGALSRRRKETE